MIASTYTIRSLIRTIIYIAISLTCSTQYAQTRIAVIADKGLENYADLLTVELSKQKDVSVVERTEIERIFKERKISCTGIADRSIELGKLTGVEFFLIIQKKNGLGEENKSCLRIQIINTAYGLKLADSLFEYDADANKAVQTITDISIKRIIKLKDDLSKDYFLVGVGSFSCENISAGPQRTATSIRSGIEENISLYPGFILADREKAELIAKERVIGNALPENLKASSILISGSFKIEQKEDETSEISVNVKCIRNKSIIFEKRYTKDMADSIMLPSEITSDIVSKMLNSGEIKPSMDYRKEAELLFNQANLYLRFNEPENALTEVEASLALDPSNLDCHNLMLSIVSRLISKWDEGKEKDGSKFTIDNIKGVSEEAASSLEYIVGHAPNKLSMKSAQKFKNNWLSFLGSIRGLSDSSKIQKELAKDKIYLQDVFSWKIPLFLKMRKVFKESEPVYLNWLIGANPDIGIYAATYDKAFELYNIMTEDSAGLFKSGITYDSPLNKLSGIKCLADKGIPLELGSIDERYARTRKYLEAKAEDPDPLIKYMALRAILELHSKYFYGKELNQKDYEYRYRTAEKMVDVTLNGIFPAYKGNTPDNYLYLYNLALAKDVRAGNDMKLKLYQKVIDKAFADKFCQQAGNNQDFTSSVYSCAGALAYDYVNNSKQPEKAIALLSEIAGQLKDDVEIKKSLQEQISEIKKKMPANPAVLPVKNNENIKFQPDKIISLGDKRIKDILVQKVKDSYKGKFSSSSGYFYGFIGVSGKAAYLPFVFQSDEKEETWNKDIVGVMKIGLDTGNIAEILVFKEAVSRRDGSGAYPLPLIEKDDIAYLGLRKGVGIVAFNFKDKSVKAEKNVECEDIYQMFFCKDKIMLVGGSPGFYSIDERALIEFNPKSRSAKLVLNPRSAKPTCEIDGKTVIAAYPDAKEENLRVLVKPAQASNATMLYKFNPGTFSTERLNDINADKKISMFFPFYQLSKCRIIPTENGILFFDFSHAVLVDDKDGISIPMSNDEGWKPQVLLTVNEQILNVIAGVPGGRIFFGKRNGKGLLYFEKGKNTLGQIELAFPSKPGDSSETSPIAMKASGNDFLILTNRVLYVCKRYPDAFK